MRIFEYPTQIISIFYIENVTYRTKKVQLNLALESEFALSKTQYHIRKQYTIKLDLEKDLMTMSIQ